MTGGSSAEFTKLAYHILCFYTNINRSFYFKNPFIFDSIYLWKRMTSSSGSCCTTQTIPPPLSPPFFEDSHPYATDRDIFKKLLYFNHESLYHCPVYEGSAELLTCLWHSTPSPI